MSRTMHFRVERTTYADIDVDVDGLIAEWANERASFDGTDEDFVREALHEIGVTDLLYSGDFVTVLDGDTDEEIIG